MVTKPNYLQEVFGYPPDNILPITNEMIRSSMPVVEFVPCTPFFQEGLDLFTLKEAWGEYTDLLKESNFQTPNEDSIKLAFLADNFPSDSFTNEYGENFLQKFTDIASEGAASIAQMVGANKATDVWTKVGDNLSQKQDSKLSNLIGSGMAEIGDMASGAMGALNSVGSFGKSMAGAGRLVDNLMAGARIDFPMVWKSSAFQPSYSFTVRLYNPNPRDISSTEKFIVGPIVAIMLLGVPRSKESSTFTWPFLHRISCPGLFNLDPGFISNITVVKGGDQQQISYQQRLGIVDIRIDVGSLYSTMLAGAEDVSINRPTIQKYAKALLGSKLGVMTREDLNNSSEGTVSSNLGKIFSSSTTKQLSTIINTPPVAFSNSAKPIVKKVSPKISAKVNEYTSAYAEGQKITQNAINTAERISNNVMNKYNELKSIDKSNVLDRATSIGRDLGIL